MLQLDCTYDMSFQYVEEDKNQYNSDGQQLESTPDTMFGCAADVRFHVMFKSYNLGSLISSSSINFLKKISF